MTEPIHRQKDHDLVEQVLTLKSKGLTQGQIIEIVWGSKKGGGVSYQRAREEYQSIMERERISVRRSCTAKTDAALSVNPLPNHSMEPIYSLNEVRFFVLRQDGHPAWRDEESTRTALLKALKVLKDDGLIGQYKAGTITRSFMERIFPVLRGSDRKRLVLPPVTNSQVESLPEIDLRYTAKVVEASAQRELERVSGQSPFDQIRHVDQHGEWWDARELQGVLGYQASWQNFENAIEKAKLSLKASDGAEVDHFNGVIKMVPLGSGANRPVNTYRLSRHACHLVAQNGDPSKPEIAAAQRYFSVQTRRAELMDAGLSPIERTVHIDALVSGQQQLMAAVEGIEDDTKKAVSKIDRIMAELVSLKTELQEKTPENKRRQFPLSVQKRVGRLFYEYTRGGGCLGNRNIQVIDANGDKISPMQFDHWDGNESRNVYDNCVPMSLELHKRKTAGRLTAEERKRIEGFIDWMRMIEDDTEETQLGLSIF